MDWESEHRQTVLVRTGPKTKVVLFTQFPTRTFDLSRQLLEELGVDHFEIDGTVSEKERRNRIHHFREMSGPCCFLLGLKSGGTGINLQTAQVGILLDLWWNPAV